MGGFLSDKLTSKRWLTIATILFIVMLLSLNFFLTGTVMLLAIIFIWNIMQWSTNPAVQSGIIEHVDKPPIDVPIIPATPFINNAIETNDKSCPPDSINGLI